MKLKIIFMAFEAKKKKKIKPKDTIMNLTQAKKNSTLNSLYRNQFPLTLSPVIIEKNIFSIITPILIKNLKK